MVDSPIDISGKMSESFQIKVGVLGNISVGKTTFLNALFRDQFGAVCKVKCTAGVHHYHVRILDDTQEAPKTMFQKVFFIFYYPICITSDDCKFQASSTKSQKGMFHGYFQ